MRPRVAIRFAVDGSDTMTVQLTGTLDSACVADIERALCCARRLHKQTVLDMSRVRLIDRPTVQYLVDLIKGDVRLGECPHHVERWLRRESTAAVE